MELANLEDTKERTHQLKMEEQQREEGDEVTLWLSLPGRRMESIKFKLGVTVAYVRECGMHRDCIDIVCS